MPNNGWYGGNADTVTDVGNVNGWAGVLQYEYGSQIAGGRSYRFGPLVNNFGTWGQLIYRSQVDLAGQDMGNPTGLNGIMPPNNAPDNSIWVQGHLINGECGGGGALTANLTPISHNINMMHKGYEATIQRLVNRGPMLGSQIRMFNPYQIPNSYIIYRTHALPPPAGGFGNVPNGVAVSLGIVIGGVMKSDLEVQTEFTNGTRYQQWFANHYYQPVGAADRANLSTMIGGAQMNY